MAQIGQNNYHVYFYDLPAQDVSSIQLMKKIKELADVDIRNNPPQIRREYLKTHYTAIVKLESKEDFDKVCEKMRFFNWPVANSKDKREIRVLPFDKDVRAHADVSKRNVFIRNLPLNYNHSHLFNACAKIVGDESLIKSAKVSIDMDVSTNNKKFQEFGFVSRKYGFVSFNSEEAAQKLIAAANHEGITFHEYAPKDRKAMRKVYNTVIVKNFRDHDISNEAGKKAQQDYITNLFSKFGQVSSVFVKESESKKPAMEDQAKKQIAFVCFADADTAAKAVEEMNGKEIEGKKLYVTEALKKQQLAKEIFKFKNSKKRCNLFVKNIKPDTTDDKLKEFFSGMTDKGVDAIESIKIQRDQTGAAKCAFVCFKSPEQANEAKSKAANQTFEGQKLTINNYELKEIREIQILEIRDKTDYQNHVKPVGGASIDQVMQKPEILQTLQYLMEAMSQNKRPYQQNRQHGGQMGMGGRQGGYQQRNPMQQQRPPMPQPNVMPQPGMNPNMMQQPGMMQPQPNQMPGGMPPQMQMDPRAMRFAQTCGPVIPGIIESNPDARNTVGEKIYEFITELVGENKAPKVTGMLIDLPIDEMRAFMSNYGVFQQKVQQASDLLTSQEGQ